MSDELPTYGLTAVGTAIVYGPKRIENRDRRPPDKIIGERIAVQTAKTVAEDVPSDLIHPWNTAPKAADEPDGSEEYVSRLERHHPGHIIGTVRCVGWCDPENDRGCCIGRTKGPLYEPVDDKWTSHAHKIRDGGKFGRPKYDCHEVTDDPWWQGPVGWLLDDPHPLDEPVPVRGMSGVWSVEKQVREAKG